MRAVAVVVAIFSLSFVGQSIAADLPQPAPYPPPVYAPPPPPPPYSWTGFYLGGNAGYGFATGTLAVGGVTGLAPATLSGFVGGGQIGANYQLGNIVLGIEGDFDGTSQKITYTTLGVAVTETIPWLATVRGRVGVAIDRLLIYTTGGVGFGDFTASAAIPGIGSVSASKSSAALAVGGGIEVGITNNISARVEYLYLDTGNVPLTTIAGTSVAGRIQDNLARAGVNYKF
jgi:outer membrane immunogenic protein